MKKIWIYLLGVLSGAILTFIILIGLSGKNGSMQGLSFFDEPGQVMSEDSYTVFQALEPGTALASSGILFGMTVLLWDEKGTHYYDGQTITASEGKCFRQIGVFKYETKNGTKTTVPVVALMNGKIEKKHNPKTTEKKDNDYTFFDEPGEIMIDKSYKVSHVISKGAALARGKSEYGTSYLGLEVLLWDENAEYYDGQIVKANNGKSFMQIGIYKNGIFTYPIVTSMNTGVSQKAEHNKTIKKTESPNNNKANEVVISKTQNESQINTLGTKSESKKIDKNSAYRLVKD